MRVGIKALLAHASYCKFPFLYQSSLEEKNQGNLLGSIRAYMGVIF